MSGKKTVDETMEAPPAYQPSQGGPSSGPSTLSPTAAHHDEDEQSTLTPDERRSFIDEHRPLPEGWIRQFDANSQHQYCVDTKTGRSTWNHPEDDEQFCRERDQRDQRSSLDRQIAAVHPEPHDEHRKRSVGEKIKDKVTGKTHEERVADRKRRVLQEKKAEQEWRRRRQAMIEQQQQAYAQQGYGAQPGYGAYGPAYQQGYGGMYGPPVGPYGRRPMGGGGMALPLLGGLAGGLLVGDLLF